MRLQNHTSMTLGGPLQLPESAVQNGIHAVWIGNASLSEIARAAAFPARGGKTITQERVHVSFEAGTLRKNNLPGARGQERSNKRLSNDFCGQ